MAIEIIDGFKLSRLSPIDDRIVASGSTARNAIAYKYQGLRVYDTFDSTPYVWMGNNWIKESQFSLSVPSNVTLIKTTNVIGSGTSVTGQVLKVFDSGSKLLTNSIISETIFYNSLGNQIGQGTVGIGYATPPNDSGIRLDVNGTVKATSFVGSGANINNIDPQNLNTTINKIQISQIEPGGVSNANYVLRTNAAGTSLEWTNVNDLVEPSSISTSLDATSAQPNYIPFVPGLSGGTLKINNSTLAFIPASSQLIIKNTNTPNTPALSFSGDTNTGIYRPADKSIGFSTNGNVRVTIDTVGIKVTPGTSTNLGFSFIGANNYGFYQATNLLGYVINGTERLTVANTGLTINADGNLLKLKGTTTAMIELYRTGGSTSTGYIGYNSSSLNQLVISNKFTSGSENLFALSSDGRIFITSNISDSYGVSIRNNGTSNGYALMVTGNYTTAQTQNPTSIARFDATDGTNTYTSGYFTAQGLYLWGYTGAGAQTNFSGSAAKPSLSFNGSSTSGIYSDAANTIGISSNGTEMVRVNTSGMRLGTTGNTVRTHIAGYVKFTRNSNGGGFSYIGAQKGGVTNVIDVSPSGSSFVSTTGLILLDIKFPANTFLGSPSHDNNTVLVSFGYNETSGNILYYCQNISAQVTDSNTIRVRMDFAPVPSAGYVFRLNFIVQTIFS